MTKWTTEHDEREAARRGMPYPDAQPVIVNVQQTTPQQTPNRLLHAAMTLVTGGLWLPVWLIAEHRAKRRNR